MRTELLIPRPETGSAQTEEIKQTGGKSEENLPSQETINKGKDEVGKSEDQTYHTGPLEKPEGKKVVTFDIPLEIQANNSRNTETESGESQDSSRVADKVSTEIDPSIYFFF